jgi:DNA polymerase-3 subunit alpha
MDRFECHAHTHYSNIRLLDCINRPKDLINRAIELDLSGIAITDHDCLSSHMELNIYAQEILKEHPDFKIALGNEIYLCRDRENGQKYYHFILIAKNKIGHRALRELSSRAWMNSYFDRGMERVVTTYEDLAEIVRKYPNSLIATTACFLPNQKVRTLYGDVNIEDITDQDYIMNSNGEWEKINFPTSRNYCDKGNIITFSKEPLPIKCTKNHQFLILNSNEELIWKEAQFLQKNDKCLEPIPKIQYTNKDVIDILKIPSIINYREKTTNQQNYSRNIFRMTNSIKITNEIMRLFGLWLADGHISKHEEYYKNEIGFTFSDKEFLIYYNGFVKKALIDLGLSENDYCIKERFENHRVDLTINKVEFCLFMEYLFGISHAENKYIPTELLHISKDLDSELFFGYLLGDGYFRYRKGQGGEVVAASISKELIKNFEQLGISLDLSGSITISKARIDKNNVNHRTSYYLTYSNAILGLNLTKEKHISHEELIEILDKGKIKKKQFLDFITINGVKYRIKKVKTNEVIDINEKVYCLNTDSHNFVLNNIIVHNCLGGELSTQTLNLINAEKVNDLEGTSKAHDRIVDFVLWCKELFGLDFYIECAPGCSKDQIAVNNRLLSISTAFEVPMVIGTDAHYLKKEDRFVHKAYLNSKGGEREVDDFYQYSYLQTNEEIQENLNKSFDNVFYNFTASLFANSMDIYNKIENYDLRHSQQIPKVTVKDYPKSSWWGINNLYADEMNSYPILKSMFTSNDKIERYWVNECWNALNEKIGFWGDNYKYVQRLEEEADIKRTIGEKLHTNMFAYPVTLQHYVNLFWECGSIVGAGRGSSCSGLNHYLLGITQLDPLEWNLPFWRYLNKERTELGDIDLDLCPSKRPLILNKIKEERGQNFNSDIDELSRKNLGCTLIATFGTEGTKSAVLTACRGYRSEEYPDGIDSDTAQYIASLIPSERGFLWSLSDVVNGNSDKERKPIKAFISEVNQYPGLLDIMIAIEGLINKRSSHASGVILFDEDPYEFGCFMKTPKGEIITQYDLHMSEAGGMTKYDFLVTEVQDKLAEAIKLLQKYNEIDNNLSLREVYNKYFHPSVLPIDDDNIWKVLQENSVLNIFQFDSEVGGQAAKKIKPTNILEMADANGLMRLMTSEKGQETPMEKYVRFKNNISLWYQEMTNAGLTLEEQETLKPYFLKSHGVPPSQEQLMMMLMDENICGFTLAEANAARKIVGKKQMSKIPELKEKVLKQAKSKNLGNYVWNHGIGPQMGYSFSIIHALAYSFIGFQTMFIATKWNPIYWNTACLIVNSGSLEEDSENEFNDEDKNLQKKEKNTDYAKTAKALGDIISRGIKVTLVDINKSNFSFEPDVENNQILFGLKALSGINTDVINKIIAGRPYKSFIDFLNRCPLNKTAMISLIKAGSFDNLEKEWAKELNIEPRVLVMIYYILKISEPKKRLTLQNFNGLMQRNLVPEDLTFTKRVYIFNDYLKKNKKVGKYYIFDEACDRFYSQFFNMELLQVINGYTCILQSDWEKIYQKEMDAARAWLTNNQDSVLKEFNYLLFKESWDKYAEGTISAWEMEALCFYYHEHELININTYRYGVTDFFNLPEEPQVDYFFKRNGKEIPIYKLYKIIGTVISKDDAKSSVTVLTTRGVVTVKFTKEYYAMYNRRISEIEADGSKKVKEEGWFKRGTKIMVTGFRRENQFVAKTYQKTESHQLYKIVQVNNDTMILEHNRYGQGE